MNSSLVLFIDKSVFENKYVWDDNTNNMVTMVSEVLAKSLRPALTDCVCFVNGTEFERIKKQNYDMYKYGHVEGSIPVHIRKLIKKDWIFIGGLYFIEEC